MWRTSERVLTKSLLALAVVVVSSNLLVAGGNANLNLGFRVLQDEIWGSLDDQLSYGLQIDLGKEHWPINIEFGFQFSEDDEEELEYVWVIPFVPFPAGTSVTSEASVSELSVGVVKNWRSDASAQPFVGGGLVRVEGEIDFRKAALSDTDNSLGGYIHGGVTWSSDAWLSQRVLPHIGFDVRVVFGTDLELLGVKGDADYYQVGFLAGLRW